MAGRLVMGVWRVSWKPRRYPMMGTTSAQLEQIARLVAIRRRERVFKGILGMVLIVYFVILGIVAILGM